MATPSSNENSSLKNNEQDSEQKNYWEKFWIEYTCIISLLLVFFTNDYHDLFFPVSALVFFYLVGKHAYKYFLLPSDKKNHLTATNSKKSNENNTPSTSDPNNVTVSGESAANKSEVIEGNSSDWPDTPVAEPSIKEQEKAEQTGKNLEERVNDAKKYAFQYVLLPLFFGMVTYLVSDTIAGKKELITIGITEHSPYDPEVLLEHYRKKYINVANRLLGNSDLSFEIVTISGKYESIWTALDNERIDIAFVSPYNFYKKACDSLEHQSNLTSLFDNWEKTEKLAAEDEKQISMKLKKGFKKHGFKIIGGKYTELGDTYRFGFIVNKKYKDTIKNSASICTKIETSGFKLILSAESLSTSGRIAPLYWLRKVTPLDTVSLGINEKIDSVAHSKNGKYVGTFSDDMWNFLKQHYPDSIKNLFFVPVDTLPLPLDAVVVKTSNWSKINSPGKYLMDLLRLRNITTLSPRGKVIKRSLRLIMDTKNDSKDYMDEYLRRCHYTKIGLMWWEQNSRNN